MKRILFIFYLLPLFIQAQVIVTVAGTGTAGYSGDGGAATAAALDGPRSVALDDSGNLYICDVANRRIRKVSPGYGGTIKTIAGTGIAGYSGDGDLGVSAKIWGSSNIAVDHKGNVYISDGHRVRKITPTDTITTIAGTGVAGYNGDGIQATAAQLNTPYGIAVDDTGNIIIGDAFNYRIRKIDTSGVITTIAGTGISGFSPDGERADTSEIHSCISLKIGKEGYIYFTDSTLVRRIGTAGLMTTVAGNGMLGYSGDGGPATAASADPTAIEIDTSGNMFIAEESNHRIRRVNTFGIIQSVAGSGMGGFGGDGGNPLVAKFAFPEGIAINSMGDLYIGDVANNRVRMVTTQLDGIGLSPKSDPLGITIFPNPTKGDFSLHVNASTVSGNMQVVISDVNGKEVDRLTVPTNKQIKVTSCYAPGMYTVSASSGGVWYTGQLVVE
jgi:sugar lactone lactonase YvrE